MRPFLKKRLPWTSGFVAVWLGSLETKQDKVGRLRC